jgi:hypothetical protein
MDGFDRAGWARGAGNYDGANVRLDMVSSAREAGVGVGAPRDKIRELLGQPDSTGPETDIWYLGRSDHAVDFLQLRIRYDARGLASSVDEVRG